MKLLLIFTYYRLAFLSCDAGNVCISEPVREERGRKKRGEVHPIYFPLVYFVRVG